MNRRIIALGLNTIIVLIPVVAYFLIKMEWDIYQFRVFIVEYLFYILLVLAIICSISFFSKAVSRKMKYIFLLELVLGVVLYLTFYDFILPW